MGMVKCNENARVVVYPRSRGDFGFASIGGLDYTFEQEIDICREIERDIARHVDNTGSNYIHIEYDTYKECEHCGCTWTEADNSPHNGGCCDEDYKIMEALESE